jgi:hypothetical protein
MAAIEALQEVVREYARCGIRISSQLVNCPVELTQ